MNKQELIGTYRAYLDCLNRQDWANLGQFVHTAASHNGKLIGLAGYQKMLENDFLAIPDLHFTLKAVLSDPPSIASRLSFDCCPKGYFLGLPVNGKRVRFVENVFYEFADDRIKDVFSIVDKGMIEAQL